MHDRSEETSGGANANERSSPLSRREMLALTGLAGLAGMFGLGACSSGPKRRGRDDVRVRAPFKLALMQSSLRASTRGDMLSFAHKARTEHQFRAIGYNSTFFAERARENTLLKMLAQRATDAGVKPLVLQVDDEGLLGDTDSASRTRAVVAHHKWADAAKKLGCEALVVRPGAVGPVASQADALAEGLTSLSNYTQQLGLRLLVRNGGTGAAMSMNPAWMAGVLRRFDRVSVAGMADMDAISDDPKLGMRMDEGMRLLAPFAAAMVLRGLRTSTPLAEPPTKRSTPSQASMIRGVLEDAIKGRGGERGDAQFEGFRGYVFVDVQEASSGAEDASITASREYLDAVAAKHRDVM